MSTASPFCRQDKNVAEPCWYLSVHDITAYLLNGGTRGQAIAAHESPRTTKLYDRTADEVNVEDIEKIGI